jgi:hypothetical protein
MFTVTMNLIDLTSQQLKRAAAIKDKMAALEKELTKILGNSRAGTAVNNRGTMSVAARRKIAASQRARWAKARKRKSSKPVTKAAVKKTKMSGAARAKVAARMRAYWKAKKVGKSSKK